MAVEGMEAINKEKSQMLYDYPGQQQNVQGNCRSGRSFDERPFRYRTLAIRKRIVKESGGSRGLVKPEAVTER